MILRHGGGKSLKTASRHDLWQRSCARVTSRMSTKLRWDSPISGRSQGREGQMHVSLAPLESVVSKE